VCDPDTGLCGVVDGVVGGGQTPNAGVVGAISPTVLDQSSGWTSSILLMLLVVGLTLGLIIAPALVWRRLARQATA
jgi:hypothetical protein